MRRRLLPVVAIAAITALVLAGLAAPAQALNPFGAPAQIVNPGCTFSDAPSDVVRGSDGLAHGFVSFAGGTCGTTIHYFQGAGSTWTDTLTPYHGTVLATAWDTTGSYLLYRAADGLRITKRTTAGVFTGGRRISASAVFDGDVVARGGEWWAVWVEDVGAQSDLFQASTLGPFDHARQRITFDPLFDLEPSLALSPAVDAMVLFWVRERPGIHEVFDQLRAATANLSGRWTSRSFTDFTNVGLTGPDVTVTASKTFVAWHEINTAHIVESDNLGGAFTRHTFLTPGIGPHIAFAGGEVFVGWTTLSSPRRAFVAERSGSTWTGRYASPVVPRNQHLLGMVVVGGKATAIIASIPFRIYATTET